MNETDFMEKLHAASAFAQEAGGKVSADDVRKLFEGMDLTAQQVTKIQTYLNQENPEDGKEDPEVKKREKAYDRFEKEAQDASVVSPGEYMVLVRDLPTDNRLTLEKIYAYQMPMVVKKAREYDHPQIRPEDMIQQGYIRLWEELVRVNEKMEAEELDEILEAAVTREMQDLVIQTEVEKERENSAVSRASMVFEAQKLMAEENGVMPSLRELSAYTNLPAEEVRDILALIKKGRKETDRE